MTRSLANCDAEGGMMERPGGGLFLEVFGAPKGLGSVDLPVSGPSPLADFCNRDSMIDRCWSRTEMLRWSCSLIAGSWVWKPGDKQASPTSCIARPSRPVNGPREVCVLDVMERSSLRGRWRVPDCRLGEAGGSFLIEIFDAGPPLRELKRLA